MTLVAVAGRVAVPEEASEAARRTETPAAAQDQGRIPFIVGQWQTVRATSGPETVSTPRKALLLVVDDQGRAAVLLYCAPDGWLYLIAVVRCTENSVTIYVAR